VSTEREAAVRLTLDGAQFVVSMRKVGDTVEQEQRKAAKESSRWAAGINKAKDAAKDLGSKLKDLAGMAVTLGGAFSLGAAVHEVLNMEGAYKSLAFAIKAGTGDVVSWQALMKDGEHIADTWKRSNEEVAGTVRALYDDIGDIEFAKSGAETIAMVATALRTDMAALTPIVGALNEKFGVTAREMPEALTAAVSLASKGGISIGDMGEKLNQLGASAKLAGYEGKEGFQQLIGLMNLADGSLGGLKKSVAGVGGLLEQLADPDMNKKLKQAFQLDIKKGEGTALEKIIAKTKGNKDQLAKVFGGEQLKLLVDLGKNYATAFEETEGKVKDKSAAGLRAFNAALAEAGRSTLTQAELEKEAAEATKDPQRELQAALNELHKAVAQLAKFLAVLLKFAGQNPLLSGALALGAKPALAFAQGAIMGGGKGGAKDAIETGEKIAKAASASPAWAKMASTVGALMGGAAAAYAAYEIGKAAIDADIEEHDTALGNIQDATRAADQAAGKNGSLAEKKAASAALGKQIASEEERTPGALTWGLGEIAHHFDQSIPTATQVQGRNLGTARDAKAKLDQEIAAAEKKPFNARVALGLEKESVWGVTAKQEPPKKKPAGKQKTEIENTEQLSRAMARALSQTTLKVETVGGQSVDGSRGPLTPPAPGAGS
jgi:hypothetical protein